MELTDDLIKAAKAAFKMPTAMKITGRTSSITNAFGNGIIPCVTPTPEQILHALQLLNMDPFDVRCVYCGDKATEWDHFHPLIRNKEPSGYISEIHNLVPCCSKCNQSKGNKQWKLWMKDNAKLSPKTRNIPDLDARIKILENYENECTCTILHFKHIPEISEDWKQYWKNHDDLLGQMRTYQELADKIQVALLKHYNSLNKK